MSTFKLTSHRAEVQAELERRVQAAMTRCAGEMEKHAKRTCPVDTGRLRNSVATEVSEGDDSVAAYVGTNVEYAPHVELGTKRMKAQPFLKPAVANHQSAYKRIISSYKEVLNNEEVQERSWHDLRSAER